MDLEGDNLCSVTKCQNRGLILSHPCEITSETAGGVCCRPLGAALFAVTGQRCLNLSKPFEYFF